MELPVKYDPALTEDKWYAYWLKNGFFIQNQTKENLIP